MSTSPKWADEPWKLLQTPSAMKDVVNRLFTPSTKTLILDQTDQPAHYIANEMAFAHNAMVRGLNAIYIQAPHIPPSTRDASDFLFFIASWSGWIFHHHDLEEEKMFPGFEAVEGVGEGALKANLEQHDAFSKGLEELNRYATITKSEEYDGKKVCSMIDAFGDALRTHLADEIGTLWALDCVAIEHAQKLAKVYSECETYAMNSQSKFVVPPMVMGLAIERMRMKTTGRRCLGSRTMQSTMYLGGYTRALGGSCLVITLGDRGRFYTGKKSERVRGNTQSKGPRRLRNTH